MNLFFKFKNFFYERNSNKTFYKINYSNKSVLITGSNSGIGLALTKLFLKLNNTVYAIVNSKNNNLKKIKNKNLIIIKCNLSYIKNLDSLKVILKNKIIHLIMNCAVAKSPENDIFGKINYRMFINSFIVNALSALKISEIVLNFGKKGHLETIVNLSSRMGSIKNNFKGNDFIYRTTKTALNAITKNMSINLLKKNGVKVFAVCPGHVKTQLNPKALTQPDTCALNLIYIISNATNKLNGKFIDLTNKKEIYW
jgi:NAD(P)-dependent dehydrogenase (short-subunit alcohol dehydrogenase family)